LTTTPSIFADRMRDVVRRGDINNEWGKAHQMGDTLLCAMLEELGYEEGVRWFLLALLSRGSDNKEQPCSMSRV
jgi:hypothetical protein